MGILKIRHQDSSFENSSYAPNVDDMVGEERSISGEESGNDFGDSELPEVECERNMFQGQLINIPYELYDLPDLKDILSVETWDNRLTEEERFLLSAYLPDMDQQTFQSTMKELLGGKDMFFDSPLAVFFRNLKGGFYQEKVACYKDGLQFLHKIASCHSLRSYHENMIRNFSDMKRCWDACSSSISVNERIQIWKAGKNHKEGVISLDLNAYPEDEILSDKEVNGLTPIALPPPVTSEMKPIPLKTSSKGVLKIKPTGSTAVQTSIPEPTLRDGWVYQRRPMGVLKIAQRQDQPRAMWMPPEVSVIDIPVSKKSRIFKLPSPIHRHNAKDYEDSLSQVHIASNRYYYTTPRLPDPTISRQVDCLNDITVPAKNFYHGKDTYFDSKTNLRGHNLFSGNSETISEGDGSSKNPIRYVSETKISMQDIQESRELSQGKQVAACLDASGTTFRGGEELRNQSAVSTGLQDELTLPITYKRRKTQTNQPLQLLEPLVVPMQEGNHRGECMKPFKIKFKNWNGIFLQTEGFLRDKPHIS